jgi:hypothetical protein
MGIKLSGDWDSLTSLSKRVAKFGEQATEIAVQNVKKYLERELPKAPGGEVYGAVTVRRASGNGGWEILVDVLPEKIKSLNPKTNVFYIKHGSAAGEIVAQQNPYSFDTLPAYTGIDNAEIIYRRVRESEVATISTERKKTQQALATQLTQAGIQVRFGAGNLEHEVTRDMKFQLDRMEYGIASEPSNPIMGRMDSEGIIGKAILNDRKLWEELLG